MMLTHVLALLLATNQAVPTAATGARATMRGVIRDQQGAAIPKAAVDVSCGTDHRRATTSASGQFALSDLPATKCILKADSRLFETQTTVVDLTSGNAVTTIVLAVKAFATYVVVTPTRGLEETSFSVPEAISVTTREDINSRPHHLLPQVLSEEPGILLQQTTTSQVSPIIRGFTGQSNVYLVDGVRFNASSWRSGPSQYLGWIEGGAADRVEVVRGPSSVQYGSDALGGTIHVLTARPAFSSAGIQIGGDVQAVLGSADMSAGGQANLRIQGSKAAFSFGVSTLRVDDLRPGGGIDSHAAVTRFLGLPSTVVGTRMSHSGFDQSGRYLIGEVRTGAASQVHTVFMHQSQTGASRYDRMDGGEGLYRSGFEPQELAFGLVRYERRGGLGLDNWSATLSMNRQNDGRFEQSRPTSILDRQVAMTTALGYQLEGQRRLTDRHQLITGVEFYDESIEASRQQINPATGVAVRNRPDIPDGTEYSNFGLFMQSIAELVPRRVFVRGGLRFGRFGFSTKADSSLGVLREHSAAQAVTFNAGLIVGLTSNLKATFNVGRGFRAANAADLGNIGLTGGGGFEITASHASALGGFVGTTVGANAVSMGERVPALGPEVVYAFEPGLKFRAGRFSASFHAYDLEYFDAIQRRAVVFSDNLVGTTIAGYQVVRQDANGLAYIAQDVRPIATRVNVDHARILGFDVEGDAQIARQWSTRAFLSMSNGRLRGNGEFLRRMPPPLGGAALKWSGRRTWAEAVVAFAGRQVRFNSGDLTDARIGGVRTRASIASYFNGTATDIGLVRNGVLVPTGESVAQVQNRLLGTAATGYLYTEAPGYVIMGARAGWRLSPQLALTIFGENLMDQNYRLFGSGVDAPGVNLQVKTLYSF